MIVLIIGASGLYYYFKPAPKASISPSLWLPSNGSITCKVDFSDFYLDIAKELVQKSSDTEGIATPETRFLKELYKHKGAGINYLSPFYCYTTIKNEKGVLLSMDHPDSFSSFATHSTLLEPIENDSSYQLIDTPWKVYWNNSILAIYSEKKPQQNDSSNAIKFNPTSKLFSAIINTPQFPNSVITANPSDLGWDISIDRYKPIDPTHSFKLPKEECGLDLFTTLKDTSIRNLFSTYPVINTSLKEISGAIHFQYLGLGEKEIKSISYEYNDDFEMEEVISISKVPTQKIRLLINTTNKEEALKIKANLDPKIGFLSQHTEITENYILYSDKAIKPIKDTSGIENKFHYHLTKDLNTLANQFKINPEKYTIDSLNLTTVINKAGISNSTISLFLPTDKRGLITSLKHFYSFKN